MGKKNNKKAVKAKSEEQSPADILAELGDMFKPMPPNKRSELNNLVEKLLKLTSNYVEDESPQTPLKLFSEFQEIYALVDKIHTLEDQFNMTRRLRGSRQLHMDTFLEWLNQHGAKIQGVKVHDYGSEQGFGLKVTEDIKHGEEVVSIPRKLFMSTETARDSTLSTLMEKDPMLRTMPNVALSLHLVLEKNSPASFWEPYINVLPNKYNTVLYFTLEDFGELKGSPAFEDALKQFKYVARQYAYFYRKFQATILKDYFTFDDYRWAVSTVMTRQNQVPVADLSKTTNTLVPFWDFSNHQSRPDSELSTDYSEEANSTVCMAERDFKKDEEFTIFYGVRSNADFLVHNGFVMREKNYNDAYVLKLGISKNDPQAAAKFQLLDSLSIPGRTGGAYFQLTAKEVPFDNILLAFVRVLCLGDDIEQYSSTAEADEKVRDLLNDATDPELDKRAFKYIETRCTLLLRSYPTTKEHDLELLKEENRNQNKINCVLLRSQEKSILSHVIQYCQSKL